jgi:hypothetical protein
MGHIDYFFLYEIIVGDYFSSCCSTFVLRLIFNVLVISLHEHLGEDPGVLEPQ